jgi:hypothetical protein
METIGNVYACPRIDVATLLAIFCLCFLCFQWAPTLNGYLQFLAESEVVYNAFESIMQEASHPECEWSCKQTAAGSCLAGPAGILSAAAAQGACVTLRRTQQLQAASTTFVC